MGSTAVLFVIVAAVLTAVMLLLTRQVAVVMQAPAEAFDQTVDYIFICSVGIVFIVGYNAVSGILRGMGDSKSPLYSVIVATVFKVGLDLVFVAVFDMRAGGAAYATVIAQACSFIFAVIWLRVKGMGIGFGKKDLRLDRRKTKGILRFGTPVALQEALVNISFLIITAILNGKGLVASAAVGVVEKVICFAVLPITAFSMAISAMTAQHVGAGKPERGKKCMVYGILFTAAVEAVVVLFVELGGGPLLLGIFSTDAEVISQGFLYMRSYIFDCLLLCAVFCMNGFFNGCGKTFFTMAHSLFATFIIRVPLAWLFSSLESMGMFEIGLAAPIATAVSIALCLIYMKSGRWKNYNTDKKEADLL